jgi:beta-glucanase (GH16 family)
MSNTIDTFKAARNLVVGAVATTGVALGTPQAANADNAVITIDGRSDGYTAMPGETLAISVSNGPGDATDWAGFANYGAPWNNEFEWVYIDTGTQQKPPRGPGPTSATFTMPAPTTPGKYIARFYGDDGCCSDRVVAYAPLTVQVGNAADGPVGVPAPDGFHWKSTFNDDFTQDFVLNDALWNGGASNTNFCAATTCWFHNTGQLGNTCGNYLLGEPENNPCQDDTSRLTFGPDGLEMRTPPEYFADGRSGVSLGGPDAVLTTSGKFTQSYGYYEVSVKRSNCYPLHWDFWLRPMTLGLPGTTGLPEVDIGEQPSWQAAGTYNQQTSFVVADADGGSFGPGVIDAGADLSTDFHTYGVWLNNDGSGPFGSMSFYLDGQGAGGGVLSGSNTEINSGMYMLLSIDNGTDDGSYTSCSLSDQASPTTVRYVRAWQLVPN